MLTRENFLQQCAERADNHGTPLLVFCLRDLPLLSWKHGRAFARRIERRASATCARMGTVLLRDADAMIHDDGSEWYAIALYARGRSGRPPTADDARGTLTRIHQVLEHETKLSIDVGWTTLGEHTDSGSFAELLQDALRKGVRERERYAFFSLIGHELRTPLTSIRGYLETVLEEDLDTATSRRFIQIAYSESLRMGRLIESLFDLSLLDLRRGEGNLRVCSVRAALDAALLATESVRERYETQLSVSFAGDAFACIHEDALTQVLINLIDNAAKHGRERGRICVSVSTDDERSLRICVEDDGKGIAESERALLFEFGRRGNSTADGSGIGLGLVRLFLERFGGEAHVGASSLGGASFCCVLPRNLTETLAVNSSPLV